MMTKVLYHLTHLKLPRISQTDFKIFVWLEHLINIPLGLEYYKKYFLAVRAVTFGIHDYHQIT